MNDLTEAQSLVVDSLLTQAEDAPLGLADTFDESRKASSQSVLLALSEARSNLSQMENIFQAALLYYRNDFSWKTRSAREQKEEALRLILLFFDVIAGRASNSDLDDYLAFLETRMEIRFFAKDSQRAIAAIESVYGEKTDSFLIRLTRSQPATIKRWRLGASGPTKSSKQILASAAEVLYQLHVIKGWDERRTIDWFEKHAFGELVYSSYGTIFSVTLERKLKDLDLSPLGVNLLF